MDILQVIKDEHRRMTQLLTRLSGAVGDESSSLWADLRLGIELHLKLEINELFPELEASLSWFGDYKSNAVAKHEAVLSAAQAFDRALFSKEEAAVKAAWESLSYAVQAHIVHEESLLFPKIRQKLSTVTREDLGELFLELQQEARLGGGLSVESNHLFSVVGQ